MLKACQATKVPREKKIPLHKSRISIPSIQASRRNKNAARPTWQIDQGRHLGDEEVGGVARGQCQCHRPSVNAPTRDSGAKALARTSRPAGNGQAVPQGPRFPRYYPTPHHSRFICSCRRFLVVGCRGADKGFLLLISRSARFSRLKFLSERVIQAPIIRT